MTKQFLPLLQTIAKDAVKGAKPVTVQTGIVDGESVQLDQQLPVNAKLPERFTTGMTVTVSGTLNGQPVSGELTLTQPLQSGDKVKVIQEDGTTNFYVLDKL